LDIKDGVVEENEELITSFNLLKKIEKTLVAIDNY